jgi:hypothetical protein
VSHPPKAIVASEDAPVEVLEEAQVALADVDHEVENHPDIVRAAQTSPDAADHADVNKLLLL